MLSFRNGNRVWKNNPRVDQSGRSLNLSSATNSQESDKPEKPELPINKILNDTIQCFSHIQNLRPNSADRKIKLNSKREFKTNMADSEVFFIFIFLCALTTEHWINYKFLRNFRLSLVIIKLSFKIRRHR